jgi:thiol-disulfide isomerase/thioredoxin
VEARYPFIQDLEKKLTAKFSAMKDEKSRPEAIPVIEETTREGPIELNLPYLSDKAFETTDNMLVFMFPSEEVMKQQSRRVKAISESIAQHVVTNPSSTLKPVKVMFVIVPPKDKTPEVNTSTIEIMCYKGQRKLRASLSTDASIPMDEWESFFTFRSAPVDEELHACVIEHVSGDEFRQKVIEASSIDRPVLVQLYEKSCFLCFLMRPFLNSLAEMLKQEPGVPFTLKRLDIEENDFPDKLPVVRGTPTFVMFRGSTEAPQRLEEFKPRDLVNRITRDYRVSDAGREKLMELVERMTLRFQTFSGLVMWSTEAEKILELISAGDQGHNATIPFDLSNSEEKDKALFNRLVSEYMTDDMLKIDTLEDNLNSLRRELTQTEKHAIMMGQVIGEKVITMEQGTSLA